MNKKTKNDAINQRDVGFASILSKLSLILLFSAIIAVYIFSILKFLYRWVNEANPGPLNILNHMEVSRFLEHIGFDSQMGRYVFIFIIIGVFILSLVLLVLGNSKTERIDKENDTTTMVIHDDVLQCSKNLIEKEDKNSDELLKKVISDGNQFYTLENLFARNSPLQKFIKILNIVMIFALFGIIWVFYRGSALAPASIYITDYLYTDEAIIIIDASMIIFILNFILHAPVFIKAFASSGFKRIYLKKYHIHETFIGILLAMAGILLLINGAGAGAYFERMCGIFMLTLGMFMIGRDWKDFVMGKFLRD